MAKILVLGATSGIAQACTRLWAERGHELFLVARQSARLEDVATDLRTRFSSSIVHTHVADLAPQPANAGVYSDSARAIFDEAAHTMGALDRVFICYGILGDEMLAQDSFFEAQRVIEVNFISHAALLLEASQRLEKGAQLAIVTSVAGDRGRGSNFVYGSAKAGLIAFVSGLRAKLFKSGIHVMDIRPGFVDTPMTEALPKAGPLWASPYAVACAIDQGFLRKRDVIYTPWFWRYIMLVIKSIPETIFKRLKI